MREWGREKERESNYGSISGILGIEEARQPRDSWLMTSDVGPRSIEPVHKSINCTGRI